MAGVFEVPVCDDDDSFVFKVTVEKCHYSYSAPFFTSKYVQNSCIRLPFF